MGVGGNVGGLGERRMRSVRTGENGGEKWGPVGKSGGLGREDGREGGKENREGGVARGSRRVSGEAGRSRLRDGVGDGCGAAVVAGELLLARVAARLDGENNRLQRPALALVQDGARHVGEDRRASREGPLAEIK